MKELVLLLSTGFTKEKYFYNVINFFGVLTGLVDKGGEVDSSKTSEGLLKLSSRGEDKRIGSWMSSQ